MTGTLLPHLKLGLPGLAQIILRRRWAGGGALSLWVLLLALAVLRWDRVAGTITAGGYAEWVALLALLLSLAGVWGWSYLDARSEERGEGAWLKGHAFQRFGTNRLALLGAWVILVSILAALLAPFVAPFHPHHQLAFLEGDMTLLRAAPSGRHLLGTDPLSRDILSRVIFGARISLTIGFLAVALSATIGTALGAVAGYMGGLVDGAIMRFVDMVMAFPRLVLLMAIVALFDEPSLLLIVLVLGLTQWPQTTRIVRGEVLSLRDREFIEAARVLGFSRMRIILRHLIPNALAPVIVVATLGIGNTIVLEAGLSFLGLGVEPPTPSWGAMVAAGRDDLIVGNWWIATLPGLVLVLVVLAFNLVGDGLRDALDPRQGGGPGP